MRGKIISVFALVVLIVGGLTYALSRATLGDPSSPLEAQRAQASAAAELELQGLTLERWIAAQGISPAAREPFSGGTPDARGEAATDVANKIRAAAGTNPAFAAMSLQLIVIVDKDGIVLGRNGSNLMRGDDLGAAYPSLKAALARGATGSDVWVNQKRAEQYLASFAPIRGADGQTIGAIAIGTSINDDRLTTISEKTSGKMLVAAVKGEGGTLNVVAKSHDVDEALRTAVASSKQVLQALASGAGVEVEGLPRDFTGAARDLEGYGDGRGVVLIAASKSPIASLSGSLLWPALGSTLLGLILVAAGGILLGGYIQAPISEIEDGLLAIMNGRTDLRFQLEHQELGGLVFRLNSLLNQLFGVQEDETDDDGRPSRAPSAGGFQDALAVDERMAAQPIGGGDIAEAQALRDEAPDAYYDRIFREYIDAKRSVGDPVDHITKDAFVGRIQASERETTQKHDKPVRYKVEVRGREVVLLAVPLA